MEVIEEIQQVNHRDVENDETPHVIEPNNLVEECASKSAAEACLNGISATIYPTVPQVVNSQASNSNNEEAKSYCQGVSSNSNNEQHESSGKDLLDRAMVEHTAITPNPDHEIHNTHDSNQLVVDQ